MDLARTLRLLPVALLPALLAVGAEPADAGRRFLDISPERVAAFQQALREFTGAADIASAELYFQARYEPPSSARASSLPPMLRAGAAEADQLRVPYGRDLSFEQDFFVSGREEDYRDAAKRWASRTLKGSDAAADRRAKEPGYRFNGAWEDGPVVGVKRGPFSARVGYNGEWRLRYSRPIASRPGWMARAWVGSEDGDEEVGFSIGRSLVASTRTK